MRALLNAIFVGLKELEVLVAKIAKRAEDRVRCGLSQSAKAGVFNQIAKLLQLLEVFQSPASFDDLR